MLNSDQPVLFSLTDSLIVICQIRHLPTTDCFIVLTSFQNRVRDVLRDRDERPLSLPQHEVALHRRRRGPPHQEHALQADQGTQAVPGHKQTPFDRLRLKLSF